MSWKIADDQAAELVGAGYSASSDELIRIVLAKPMISPGGKATGVGGFDDDATRKCCSPYSGAELRHELPRAAAGIQHALGQEASDLLSGRAGDAL